MWVPSETSVVRKFLKEVRTEPNLKKMEGWMLPGWEIEKDNIDLWEGEGRGQGGAGWRGGNVSRRRCAGAADGGCDRTRKGDVRKETKAGERS